MDVQYFSQYPARTCRGFSYEKVGCSKVSEQPPDANGAKTGGGNSGGEVDDLRSLVNKILLYMYTVS